MTVQGYRLRGVVLELVSLLCCLVGELKHSGHEAAGGTEEETE